MRNTLVKKIFYWLELLFFHLPNHKGYYYLGKNVVIKGKKSIYFDENIHICSQSVVICGGKLKFGENTYIGFFSEIMCIHDVQFGKNIICGPFLFITDSNHEYRDIRIPISDQGAPLNERQNQIQIGDDTWIGAHVSIIGNVKIGKHCVIGAGSVVVKDIPDYCVVVGVPAKIIKTYDFSKNQWQDYKKADENN
jgi:acetyltransferase-like isoleucine patch superfamily enzyme